MNIKERQKLIDSVECEGFDYTFIHYSDFSEIEDAGFHEKRKAFINATNELAEYIGVEL